MRRLHFSKHFRLRRLLIGTAILGTAALSYLYFPSSSVNVDTGSSRELRDLDLTLTLPSREEQLSKLKSNKIFDILVIGGGSVGTGVALVRTNLASIVFEQTSNNIILFH
jgi:hypothetical protein